MKMLIFLLVKYLRYPMEKKEYQRLYKHYGAKTRQNGLYFYTGYLFYQKDGTRMESAIFFNDFTPAEEKKLEDWQPAFEAPISF